MDNFELGIFLPAAQSTLRILWFEYRCLRFSSSLKKTINTIIVYRCPLVKSWKELQIALFDLNLYRPWKKLKQMFEPLKSSLPKVPQKFTDFLKKHHYGNFKVFFMHPQKHQKSGTNQLATPRLQFQMKPCRQLLRLRQSCGTGISPIGAKITCYRGLCCTRFRKHLGDLLFRICIDFLMWILWPSLGLQWRPTNDFIGHHRMTGFNQSDIRIRNQSGCRLWEPIAVVIKLGSFERNIFETATFGGR